MYQIINIQSFRNVGDTSEQQKSTVSPALILSLASSLRPFLGVFVGDFFGLALRGAAVGGGGGGAGIPPWMSAELS